MFITNGITIREHHGKGSSFVPGTVPKVKRSIIPATGDGIMVVFDRPMHMTPDLQKALSVIVNGGTPVHPDHVDITPDKTAIGMKFPDHFFKPGDVVTWAYNDQHPTEEIKGAEVGGKEIDNQTYAVSNGAVAPGPSVVSSTIYANNHGRILVKWDTEMKGTPDVRFAIIIVIDGGSPIVPNAVTFTGNFMTLSDHFAAGQVITWKYDPTNATERLSTKAGDIEAGSGVHMVTNNIALPSVPFRANNHKVRANTHKIRANATKYVA